MNASTINLMVSFIFVFVLIIGFLIGFWRGIRKSALNMAFSLVAVVVAFFVTPLVTNAIMGISIAYQEKTITLNQYLVELLKQNQDIATLIESNPNVEILVEKIPSAVANVLIFLILSMVVMFVFYIIYRIIASIFLKRKENQKVHRTLGGVVGVIQAFIISLFVFMPLSSLLGLFGDVLNKTDIYLDNTANEKVLNANGDDVQEESSNGNNSALANFLPEQINTIASSLNNSFFFQMCGAVGLDDAMFDYYGTINIDGQDLVLRKEILNYAQIYDISIQISQISSTEKSFKDLDFEKLEVYFDQVINGTLFKQIFVDVLQEFVTNYQNYSFLNNETITEYSELLDNISMSLKESLQESANGAIEYFQNDLKSLFDIFKQLSQNGIIDEIYNNEDKTVKGILNILTADQNLPVFSSSLEELLSMNILHDGVDIVLNNFLPEIMEGIDKIAVDTSQWVDQQWKNLSVELSNVLENFSKVSSEIDIFSVLKDPTSLLNSESEVNITNALSSLGEFVDSVLNVSILKNSEGESVFNKILIDNNFVLPDNDVYANDGSAISISNYKQYFAFIAQSLEEIKENDLYALLTQSSSINDMMKQLATLLEQDANLLQNIFLPLYQVEPTKTLIANELVSATKSELIDLSNIEGYDAWKKELGYLQNILVILNKEAQSGQTYLDFAVAGNVDTILQSLGNSDATITISDILQPLLKASSTDGIKNTLFETLEEVLNQLSGISINIVYDNQTFNEDNSDNQIVEVCTVFEDFISIYQQYKSSGESFELTSLSGESIGQLFDHIKENAYRVELLSKQSEGILKEVFDGLYNKLLQDYPKAKDIIKNKPVYEISFINLMKAVVEIQNSDLDSFIGKVGELIGNDKEITVDSIEEMIGSITEETSQEQINTIDTVLGVLEDFEVEITIPGQSEEEISQNKQTISSLIENNENIDENLKNKLNNILGLL